MYISIRIDEKPVAQPRVKARRQGSFIRMYTPNNADSWKKAVGDALNGYKDIKLEGPIELRAVFCLPRPQNLNRKRDPDDFFPHIRKPDLDNLIKSTMDAITDKGIWGDDRQVWHIEASKYVCGKKEEPYAKLIIINKDNERDI